MNDKDFEDLSAYIDGELTAPRAEEVRNLIATDAKWQRAAAEFGALDRAMDFYDAPTPPAGLADRIAENIIAKSSASGKVLRIFKWTASAAAAMLVIGVGVNVLNNPTPTDEPIAQTAANQADENFIVKNLDFIGNMHALDNYDLAAAGQSPAATRKSADTDGKTVSIERQLELKRKLQADVAGLTPDQAVAANKNNWNQLATDRKAEYQQRARAFLKKSPDEQQQLLERYNNMLNMTPQELSQFQRRAKWIQTVVDNISPQQKDALRQATSAQREQMLQQFRNELIRKGILPADGKK